MSFNDFINGISKLGSIIENEANKNFESVLKEYKNKLRNASDGMVLKKLSDAEEKRDTGYGDKIYDATYREASRRGLV